MASEKMHGFCACAGTRIAAPATGSTPIGADPGSVAAAWQLRNLSDDLVTVATDLTVLTSGAGRAIECPSREDPNAIAPRAARSSRHLIRLGGAAAASVEGSPQPRAKQQPGR